MKLQKTGIPDYQVIRSHEDVVGKWGGYLAWVVHYGKPVPPPHRPFLSRLLATIRREAPPQVRYDDERLEIYRHIGRYECVGHFLKGDMPSKWEVVNAFMDVLENGKPIGPLIDQIAEYQKQAAQKACECDGDTRINVMCIRPSRG